MKCKSRTKFDIIASTKYMF